MVETKYGFHVIKVEDVREGDVSLEAATLEIAEIVYRRGEGGTAAKQAGEQFLARLKAGTPMSALIPAQADDAAPMAPQVRTSRAFSRSAKSVPGIGDSSEVVSAAFDLTLEAPLANQLFEVRGDYYVVQLKERDEPNINEFDEKKVELTETLLATKRASVLKQRMSDFVAEALASGAIERQIFAAQPTPSRAPVSPAADTPLGPEGNAKDAGEPAAKPADAEES